MEAMIQEVNCFVRPTAPKNGETIEEILNLKKAKDIIFGYKTYTRRPEECPFARGNIMIDLYLINDIIHSIKLPLDTTTQDLITYIKPLDDLIEKNKQNDKT